ncbi:OmpA family protein [Catenovulum sp. 2E275]|uniref:flagellar protein MotY n=1 Tax=Catenovulum sp. 2E275 TaxID=2980497 RepID=UPI0021CE0093|nr:OmpA family protein [Catenovulum sp. 2E275]MCU4675012.1 OmpA family protein [Catenovulum sp. 2E275]
MKKLSCLLGGVYLLSSQTFADVRQYQASLDDSNWQASNQNRLECQLVHQIPRYGKAVFSSQASRSLNLNFTLDMLRLPDNYSFAKVSSVPPSYKPGIPSKSVSEMKLLKQFDGELTQKPAWTLLTELEKGMTPTFYYQDWYSDFDSILVGLSAANFHHAYDQFLQCIDNLLPYAFEDISLTVLTYQKNSSELSKASKKRLAMIAEYLKQDADLDLVLVDAYTDSYGGRWPNQQLSEKRAGAIQQFFVDNGVDKDRIEIEGYGEKRHIASNQNVIERSKNRRVVIRMEKP